MTYRRSLLVSAGAGVGLLVLALAGCSGNPRLTLHGTVTYQNQPVKSGIVKIYGPGDHSSMAYVRDGRFDVTDVPPGDIQVTVEPDPSGPKGAAIPKKYADRKTSGLSYSITPSTHDLAIKLD